MSMRKKIIALCTSRAYEPKNHSFIEKLNMRLKDKCILLIFAINSDIYWEEDRQATEKYVYDLIPYDQIDCIIIMNEKIKSKKIADKIVEKSHEHNVPVVMTDAHYDNVSCINFDYSLGFEKVVRHIIEDHNIRKPHMMAGQPNNDFSNQRIEVFKRVLKDNNITFDKDTMLSYGYFWADPCRETMSEILKRDTLPEAMICANDIMAITVSEMLTDAGYRIPEDIIVSGFDGYDEIYFTTPKITSSSCDVVFMADATADTVLQVMSDGQVHNRSIIPEFIPNESCGCPEYAEQHQVLRDLFNESFARHNDDNRVLQQVASSMQMSESLGEMVSYLDCYKTDNVLIAVDSRCLNSDINYFTDEDILDDPKEFVTIYDSANKEMYKPDTFALPEPEGDGTKDIFSGELKSRIIELGQSGYPLVFNALDYMNRPFGFACYYLKNNDISNYMNTMLATNALSMGIGGYVIVRYQTLLLDKMDKMYRHDALTGLYNRVGFQKLFKHKISNTDLIGEKITVIMADLDGLKYINDTFGHAEGDNAIAVVAKALSLSTPESALSVRFGGDELFSVIFGECNPDEITSSITEYLDKYNKYSGKPYKVSSSCGCKTDIFDNNYNMTQALKEADDKMYVIKKNRRGTN